MPNNDCCICRMHFDVSESVLTGISFYFAHLNAYVCFLVSNYYEEYIFENVALKKIFEVSLRFFDFSL